VRGNLVKAGTATTQDNGVSQMGMTSVSDRNSNALSVSRRTGPPADAELYKVPPK
jgi:hypothetical protein